MNRESHMGICGSSTGLLACLLLTIALPKPASADGSAHLTNPGFVSAQHLARARRGASQPGTVRSHLRRTFAGKLTLPAHLTAIAATLLSPEEGLIKALSLSTAGYLALEQQLDRTATHANSDRAFALAEQRRLQGLPGVAPALWRGAGWRIVESTLRGTLTGLSTATLLSGFTATSGISDATLLRTGWALGTAGATGGLVMGVSGALKRTLGRALGRRVRSKVFDVRLHLAETALTEVLADGHWLGSQQLLDELDTRLRRLSDQRERLGHLRPDQARRLERLQNGHGTVKVYDAASATQQRTYGPAALNTRKRHPAPLRRLARIGVFGMALNLLANQGLVPRLPTDSLPGAMLQGPERRELAAAIWQISQSPGFDAAQPTDTSDESGGSLPMVMAPWGDARLLNAHKAATSFRNWRYERPKMLARVGLPVNRRWSSDVIADVEHFYVTAWMASWGGATLGAPVTALIAAGYELVYQEGLKVALGEPLDISYQWRQLVTADLSGVAYGAVSSFLLPPPK